ncbi:NAD-dependent epimerase/dehydratase family protein [Pseudoflavitalea rhizosphaerae]|uniref:NAD-dependent epimerase/dehydratase family protein n=1 Tax=Pseudoflavitalea rhizosphaerae TaxID=1884793 RepID=UPI000F8E44F5|nr:NAD-dependent epimerase/dehydratase family protein [Pseudoflavitalea rhizosphaerae]
MTQVILGAGGDIGKLLARELKQYTDRVRLVARNPQQVNGDDELLSANLLSAEQVDAAVAGTSIAYLVVGLKYDLRIWQRDWPLIMDNVINACLKHGVKLVFFDNVYSYDKQAIPHMTEESPLNPPSKKGKVRLAIVEKIHNAISQKGLKALIARSADFYGPGAKNGILNIMVLDPILKGRKLNWQSNADKVHSFTYTPDAAKATAKLGNTNSAYSQVWHLPTSSQRFTGREFVEKAASIKGVKASFSLLSPFLLRLAGLFNRTIHELVEMQYQNNQDYFFDSQKFCKQFGFTPTSYEEGMKEVLD